MHRSEPHAGHQKCFDDIRKRLGQAELMGIPKIELIALLAQIIGRQIAELDGKAFTVSEIMQAVALNIASGNQDEAARSLIGVGKPS